MNFLERADNKKNNLSVETPTDQELSELTNEIEREKGGRYLKRMEKRLMLIGNSIQKIMQWFWDDSEKKRLFTQELALHKAIYLEHNAKGEIVSIGTTNSFAYWLRKYVRYYCRDANGIRGWSIVKYENREPELVFGYQENAEQKIDKITYKHRLDHSYTLEQDITQYVQSPAYNYVFNYSWKNHLQSTHPAYKNNDQLAALLASSAVKELGEWIELIKNDRTFSKQGGSIFFRPPKSGQLRKNTKNTQMYIQQQNTFILLHPLKLDDNYTLFYSPTTNKVFEQNGEVVTPNKDWSYITTTPSHYTLSVDQIKEIPNISVVQTDKQYIMWLIHSEHADMAETLIKQIIDNHILELHDWATKDVALKDGIRSYQKRGDIIYFRKTDAGQKPKAIRYRLDMWNSLYLLPEEGEKSVLLDQQNTLKIVDENNIWIRLIYDIQEGIIYDHEGNIMRKEGYANNKLIQREGTFYIVYQSTPQRLDYYEISFPTSWLASKNQIDADTYNKILKKVQSKKL